MFVQQESRSGLPFQLHGATATWTLTLWVRLHVTPVTLVIAGTRTRLVVALVDLGIGVTELDRDIPLELVLETDRLHS